MLTKKVRIDKDFNKSEREIIIDSLKDWEKYSDGLVKFIIINYAAHPYYVEDGYYIKKEQIDCFDTVDIVKSLSTHNIIQHIDNQHENNIYGYAYPDHAPNFILIITDRLKTKKTFKDIVMHEIGHILGVSHLDDERTLMHKYYYKSKCKGISEKDIRAFIYNTKWDTSSNPKYTLLE